MPKTKFTGSATGSRVHSDGDVPHSRQEIDLIMSLAKVSEADAQWLVSGGYWGRIMHMVRTAVHQHRSGQELPSEDVPE